MSSLKKLKQAEKAVRQQQQAVLELPPTPEVQAALVRALEKVQMAMQRPEQANVD